MISVLVTGPSESGVGAQNAIDLAGGSPQEIILAGRNKDKIQPVIDQIQKINPDVKVIFAQLDLADLSSVRKAAKEISAKIQKLDVLINNAGSESTAAAFQIHLSPKSIANQPTSHGSQELRDDKRRH